MNKRITLFTVAMSVVFVCNAYASPQPTKCPSVSAIQSVGLNEVRISTKANSQTAWYGFQPRSTYDTDQEWTFMVGPFFGEQADVVFKKATESLATLSPSSGPAEGNNAWFCVYTDPTESVVGFAATPPFEIPSELGAHLHT